MTGSAVLFFNKDGQEMVMDRKKILNFTGNFAVIIAVFFILYKLKNIDIDYSIIFAKDNFPIYILFLLLYTGTVICFSIPWRRVVCLITGKELAFGEVAEVSVRANVMKYIPGNIFQYVGRNGLAVKNGLKHLEVAMSTFIDVIISTGAVFLLTFIFSFRIILKWVRQYAHAWQIGVVIGGILIAAAVLYYLKKNFHDKIGEIMGWIFYRNGIMIVLTNIIIYAVLALINAGIYMAVLLRMENQSYSVDVYFLMYSSILLSWILGFVTPGAPGGIGVREAVLIVLLGDVMSEGAIILGVIINRVISVLGDLSAMIVMIVFNTVKEGKYE